MDNVQLDIESLPTVSCIKKGIFTFSNIVFLMSFLGYIGSFIFVANVDWSRLSVNLFLFYMLILLDIIFIAVMLLTTTIFLFTNKERNYLKTMQDSSLWLGLGTFFSSVSIIIYSWGLFTPQFLLDYGSFQAFSILQICITVIAISLLLPGYIRIRKAIDISQRASFTLYSPFSTLLATLFCLLAFLSIELVFRSVKNDVVAIIASIDVLFLFLALVTIAVLLTLRDVIFAFITIYIQIFIYMTFNPNGEFNEVASIIAIFIVTTTLQGIFFIYALVRHGASTIYSLQSSAMGYVQV